MNECIDSSQTPKCAAVHNINCADGSFYILGVLRKFQTPGERDKYIERGFVEIGDPVVYDGKITQEYPLVEELG